MTYNHAHPDSDLFNEKTREITLADYVRRVTQYPCVVVGGEPPEIKDVVRQRVEKSED